jgi:hypothetical protein
MLSIAVAAGWVAVCGVAPADAADPSPAAASGVMTVTKAAGEVSIVPEPKLVNGEFLFKVVALNPSPKPATFGPEDIAITTADGKPVPIMSLDALIAQVKAQAQSSPPGAGSYNSSYQEGATTTYNKSGQPDVHNFTGSSAPIGAQINPEAPVNTRVSIAALGEQIASLRAGILQDVTIAPGDVKGGEVVTERIRFHWREKHTLHIEVSFNGEQYDFDLPAPAED